LRTGRFWRSREEAPTAVVAGDFGFTGGVEAVWAQTGKVKAARQKAISERCTNPPETERNATSLDPVRREKVPTGQEDSRRLPLGSFVAIELPKEENGRCGITIAHSYGERRSKGRAIDERESD
jgi:hypothetical protein